MYYSTLVSLLVVLVLSLGVFAYFMNLKSRQMYVGIVLDRTTNSVIAVRLFCDPRVVKIIRIFETNSELTLSLVAILKHGTQVVGAKAAAFENSNEVQYFARNSKRHIGVPYNPVEVGTAIIGILRESFYVEMGYYPQVATICVPADFNEAEREATNKAIETAGFKVKRILDEPTAAALAYNVLKCDGCVGDMHEVGEGRISDSVRIILLFDMGGEPHSEEFSI